MLTYKGKAQHRRLTVMAFIIQAAFPVGWSLQRWQAMTTRWDSKLHSHYINTQYSREADMWVSNKLGHKYIMNTKLDVQTGTTLVVQCYVSTKTLIYAIRIIKRLWRSVTSLLSGAGFQETASKGVWVKLAYCASQIYALAVVPGDWHQRSIQCPMLITAPVTPYAKYPQLNNQWRDLHKPDVSRNLLSLGFAIGMENTYKHLFNKNGPNYRCQLTKRSTIFCGHINELAKGMLPFSCHVPSFKR